MGFAIDSISLKKLVGVHPDLLRVVNTCAADFSKPFHFGISCGLRTVAQQQKNVAAGASQTMKSRHLDGHAVDLVAILNDPANEISWAWPHYIELAEAMKAASVKVNIPVNWGGCWDRLLSELSDDLEQESVDYVARAKTKGGKGFLDGPHYQLPWAVYPSKL